jgi:hypothetical protein
MNSPRFLAIAFGLEDRDILISVPLFLGLLYTISTQEDLRVFCGALNELWFAFMTVFYFGFNLSELKIVLIKFLNCFI